MTKPSHRVDPVLQRAFNEFYRTLEHGAASTYAVPIKGITQICETFGISREELSAWRKLAFPLFNIRGVREKEKLYANPERVLAWFRWRDLVQSGYIQVDIAAKDS